MSIKNIIVYSQTLPPNHVGGIETNAFYLIRYLLQQQTFRFSVVTATKKKVLFQKQLTLEYDGVGFKVTRIKKKTLKNADFLLKELESLKYKPQETVIYHNSLDLYKFYEALKSAGYFQVARSGGNDLSFLQKNAESAQVFCHALSCLDKLFVNSQFSYQRASQIGISSDVIQVVKGGCDIYYQGQADRHVLGLPSSQPIILSCGRLVDFKGLEDALVALSLVVKQGSNPLFVVVGQGALELDLKQRASELGIEKHCIFVGKVDPARVLEYYKVADIYLSSSKDVERVVDGFRYVHTETMGRSICEAQGCGVPVISTDAGGASEMVLHGKSGLIVPQANPQKMANAIEVLLQDEVQRKALAEGALQHARRSLSWNAVLNQYFEAMKSVSD